MELRKFIATTIREYLNEQQYVENYNLNDIQITINNFNDLFYQDKKIDNKIIQFKNKIYDVSFEDGEYYIKEKRYDNGEEYWKLLSQNDLKTTHLSLLNYLNNNIFKQKNKTTVDVYYKNQKINYDDFNLKLLDNNKIYVDYVNKSKNTPPITVLAYIKLAEKLMRNGYYLISNNIQFSSGKKLWDRLEKNGYVKNVDGFKTLIPKK